jgi:hypothetical protein
VASSKPVGAATAAAADLGLRSQSFTNGYQSPSQLFEVRADTMPSVSSDVGINSIQGAGRDLKVWHRCLESTAGTAEVKLLSASFN